MSVSECIAHPAHGTRYPGCVIVYVVYNAWYVPAEGVPPRQGRGRGGGGGARAGARRAAAAAVALHFLCTQHYTIADNPTTHYTYLKRFRVHTFWIMNKNKDIGQGHG